MERRPQIGDFMTRKRRLKNSKQLKNVRRKPVSFELEKEKTTVKKERWIILVLISFICLTLFFNSYFNYTSGAGINENGDTLGEKYYLLGPDPYYHARIAEHIFNTGEVPYWQEGTSDPLLAYPMEHNNPRPPLFDFMLATGANILSPFMDDIDALGLSLQFMPAIFGALLIIPVYLISKTLFNKKVGLISAFFVCIIPIHIGSGHGSAYALADHDSWLLLLTTFGVFFYLKALIELKTKYETVKELISINKKSIMYAGLTGICYSAIAMSWEGFKLVVVLLTLYTVIQLFLNCWFKKDFLGITMLGTIPLIITAIVISPYYYLRGTFNDVEIVLSLIGIILFIGLLFYYTKNKIPYVITLPSLIIGGIAFLFAVNIYQIKPFYYFVQMFFKGTVYVGKVSLTIAEAGSANISSSVMGFGPALYWVAWFGAVIFMARTLLHKKEHMYFISLYFILTLYFTMTAGRFLNDFIPFIVLFAGWGTYFIITKINYKELFKTMKGIEGFRKIKSIKLLHVFGIIFIVFLLLLPNVILTLDSAIPWQEKDKYNLPSGAYGISFGKEMYWTDAFSWLAEQDTELEPEYRPAFISWWDYGFYEAHIGKHPTVADNFQDGIEVAGNFHTSTSEKEAISTLIARFIHADLEVNHDRKDLSITVKETIDKYLGENYGNTIVKYFTEPKTNPQYLSPICEEYEPELSKEFKKQLYNSFYHQFNYLTSNLTDEEITNFYIDMQEVTGWNIRYYGTEQYDTSIFTVFSFLSDKSLMPVGGLEDDFYLAYYIATEKITNNKTKIYRETINNLTDYDKENFVLDGPYFERKPAFYDTMFYKTYYGTPVDDGSLPTNRIPCYDLKHFAAKYISPYVVIAKYYEGYKINGTVYCQDRPLPGFSVVVFDEYGIKHDAQITENDGYNVITPGGKIYLGFYLGEQEFKTIELNVTEEQAMRKTEDYNKTIDFIVTPVNLNGTLYDNTTIVPNANVTIQSLGTGMFERTLTNEEGYYKFKDLPPNYYQLTTDNSSKVVIVYENMTYDLEV